MKIDIQHRLLARLFNIHWSEWSISYEITIELLKGNEKTGLAVTFLLPTGIKFLLAFVGCRNGDLCMFSADDGWA